MKTLFTIFLFSYLMMTQLELELKAKELPGVNFEEFLIFLHFEVEGMKKDKLIEKETLKKLKSLLPPSRFHKRIDHKQL